MPVAKKKLYCPLSCLLVASLLPFSFSFAQEDGGLTQNITMQATMQDGACSSYLLCSLHLATTLLADFL
jgi:hypothetical protein